jgi:hypothetical protein
LKRYIELTVPKDKRIPSIKEFGSFLLPCDIKDDYCWINNFGAVTSNDKDALFVVKTYDKHFSLLPGPEFSPRLYRGQTKFYNECVPLLFREPITQINYLTDLLKKYEFYKLMAGHPIIKYLQGWCIDENYFKINMEGLSGHYEFATPLIDVTRSKDIAMFFAMCEKNEDNQYRPIIDENRDVVLYSIDFGSVLKNSDSYINVIGFQALPRPDVQMAYSLVVGYKENFNLFPFVSYKRFSVNRKQSEKYFEMFEGGAKLFPNDIVDDRAREIKQSMEIDREVLDVCFEKHFIPKIWANASEVDNFLKKFNYMVTDKHLEFSNEVKNQIIEKWNTNPPLYPGRVKCRFVSEPLSIDS